MENADVGSNTLHSHAYLCNAMEGRPTRPVSKSICFHDIAVYIQYGNVLNGFRYQRHLKPKWHFFVNQCVHHPRFLSGGFEICMMT